MTDAKNFIIPAFSEEAYALARQRAHDCYNDGTFAFTVLPKQYESIDDFINKARVLDPEIFQRARCRGVIFDYLVGEKDFFQNTLSVYFEIASHITFPCFLVRHSRASRCATIVARNLDELKKIRNVYWENPGTSQDKIMVIMYNSSMNIDIILKNEMARGGLVVICREDVSISFESSLAGYVFNNYDNVIIVF
ncbi:MAG: hypothetical protein AAB795_02005 [Patescibacteria group bacterium]